MVKQENAVSLDRREVVSQLLDSCRDALVVSGLGSPSYDVHAAGDADSNYYLWGAMGGAALVGLGLAQSQPANQVIVITGDGEQLMALGSFATIAVAKPNNLDIVVLDNQHYGETGMQSSHTGQGIDLSAVALACGFSRSLLLSDGRQLEQMCEELQQSAKGPRFYSVKVKAENLPRSLPPRDATFIKNRFRAHLGLSCC